jgi:hypothetical protein
MQFAGWMIKDPPCEVCMEFYKKKKTQPICGGFKCGKGKVEPLLVENEDAIFILKKTMNQAIYVGMDGVPVDVKHSAVERAIDRYRIENEKDCFEKVLTAWHHIAKIKRSKRKAESNK